MNREFAGKTNSISETFTAEGVMGIAGIQISLTGKHSSTMKYSDSNGDEFFIKKVAVALFVAIICRTNPLGHFD
jgi:hypothetical protein